MNSQTSFFFACCDLWNFLENLRRKLRRIRNFRRQCVRPRQHGRTFKRGTHVLRVFFLETSRCLKLQSFHVLHVNLRDRHLS